MPPLTFLNGEENNSKLPFRNPNSGRLAGAETRSKLADEVLWVADTIQLRWPIKWTNKYCIGVIRRNPNKQRAKMESSGGTWIGFGFQSLLHNRQTHPGAANWASQKPLCNNSLLLRQIDEEREEQRTKQEIEWIKRNVKNYKERWEEQRTEIAGRTQKNRFQQLLRRFKCSNRYNIPSELWFTSTTESAHVCW